MKDLFLGLGICYFFVLVRALLDHEFLALVIT